MKNSGDNGGNNFIEGPENTGKKMVSDIKAKVYGVYFVASIVNKITDEIEEEFQYSTLSEEDYKKVLESKGCINPPVRVDVDVTNGHGIISKAQLGVQGVFLIH